MYRIKCMLTHAHTQHMMMWWCSRGLDSKVHADEMQICIHRATRTIGFVGVWDFYAFTIPHRVPRSNLAAEANKTKESRVWPESRANNDHTVWLWLICTNRRNIQSTRGQVILRYMEYIFIEMKTHPIIGLDLMQYSLKWSVKQTVINSFEISLCAATQFPKAARLMLNSMSICLICLCVIHVRTIPHLRSAQCAKSHLRKLHSPIVKPVVLIAVLNESLKVARDVMFCCRIWLAVENARQAHWDWES